MPRRKWTTEEQYEWLSERIPDFVEAQQTGTVSVFITSVTQKWYQEWPPGEPTEDEVEEAKEAQHEEHIAQSQQKPLPNPEGMVKALDPTTFTSFLDEGPAFIKFYAPLCGHCKKLAPTWTQLAAQLRNKLNVAEVNCDLYKSLCTKHMLHRELQLYTNDVKHDTESFIRSRVNDDRLSFPKSATRLI